MYNEPRAGTWMLKPLADEGRFYIELTYGDGERRPRLMSNVSNPTSSRSRPKASMATFDGYKNRTQTRWAIEKIRSEPPKGSSLLMFLL